MGLELTDQRLINTILEQSVNAIVISDLEGNLQFVNQAFLSLWGYDNIDEILGKNALTFTDDKENQNSFYLKSLPNPNGQEN